MSDITKTHVSQLLRNDVKPANPRRGAGYRDLAINFVSLWPIGSSLTWEEFGNWAHENDLLDHMPAEDEAADKQGDVWLAHLQRRHQVRAKITKASTHPELNAYGGSFVIVATGGRLSVRSTAMEIAQGDAPRRITSLATTQRKKLEYLIQSSDWSQIPPHERALAEAILEDIDNYVERIDLESTQLDRKYQKLRSRMKALVKIGEIRPVDGGVAGLIENDAS